MHDSFSKYLDDEKFIEWISNPTGQNDDYWEGFMRKNPQEKKTILALKEYLAALGTKEEKLTAEEKHEILQSIYGKMDFKEKDQLKVPVLRRFLKYAAVFVVLIGSILYYRSQQEGKELNSTEVFKQVSIDSVLETKLLLEDDNLVTIAQKKSEIDYKDSKGPVINGKDTVKIAEKVDGEELVLNQLVVPYGKRSKLTLADGTVVHLNSGSRFVFPRRFVEEKREVYLDGEAFFEVASNKEKPFKVKVFKDNDLSIEVVGTKFNVNSYGFHDRVVTVLTEGEVHLKDNSKKSLFSKEKKTVMRPGELAEWSVREKQIKNKKKVDIDYYTSWIEGIFIFRSEPLERIIKKLEIYYNVKIDLDEAVQRKFRITGKLDLNDDIEKTMENLALAASLKHEKIKLDEYLILK
ncbi:FecR family protein [Spongiimicrobium sp. 3-5]|uniref:FecR family protein n=1 Tax=Spongiimicrobium sp. 3-5 TaxID=3332596 RepID=UPI0039814ADB